MAQAPDLFVVCKTCNNEVSPYITECPYCGTRLRKRAPKIERDGTVAEPKAPRRGRRAAAKPPKAPRRERRRRERPSWKGDAKPWATMTLVGLSVLGFVLLSALNRGDVALAGPVGGDVWRIATTVFLYDSFWYQLACVLPIGLFGWLLERRHGPAAPLLLFVLCGMGGAAVVAGLEANPLALGANGAALGLLAAWAVPDVLRARRREEHEADLPGVLVLALVVLLMPVAVAEANPIAGVVGLGLGLGAGLVLARR
jgi:membrane associated rhomboid family serine protease